MFKFFLRLANQFEGSLKFMLYLYVDSRGCRNDTVVIVADVIEGMQMP